MFAIAQTRTRNPGILHAQNLQTFNYRDNEMLETIIVLLVILWLLGLVTSTTMGGFIHILLVIAVIVLIFRVISGRRI